jgi:heat shock protein HslJ
MKMKARNWQCATSRENSMIRLALSTTLLGLLAASALANGGETFRAQGNEPSWSLRITDGTITFQPLDGNMVTVAPIPQPRQEGDAVIHEAKSGGDSFTLTIGSKICTDTMSGMPFPKSVTVALGEKTFTGCGGEPATLLRGAWLITEINGKTIVAGSTPSLSFEADGKVNGDGSCNRFFGGYQLSGEGLTVGNVGASMMMCGEALMEQERQIFAVLKDLAGFGISEDGELILRTKDGRTMTAKRGGLQ